MIDFEDPQTESAGLDDPFAAQDQIDTSPMPAGLGEFQPPPDAFPADSGGSGDGGGDGGTAPATPPPLPQQPAMPDMLQPEPAEDTLNHPDLPHLAFAGALARGAQQYRDTNGTLPSGQDLQDIGNRAMLESYGTTDRSAIPAKSANPAQNGGLSGVFSNIGSFISDTLMPSADAAEAKPGDAPLSPQNHSSAASPPPPADGSGALNPAMAQGGADTGAANSGGDSQNDPAASEPGASAQSANNASQGGDAVQLAANMGERPRGPWDKPAPKPSGAPGTGQKKPDLSGPDDSQKQADAPPPDGSDPVAAGRWMAGQLGLKRTEELVGSPEDAAAIGGVANFRFLDRDGQNHVMRMIDGLENKELRGQLLGKIGDLQVQPQWTPTTMTDDELKHAIAGNKIFGTITGGLGAVPGGKVTGIFGMISNSSRKTVAAMEAELQRRQSSGQHH